MDRDLKIKLLKEYADGERDPLKRSRLKSSIINVGELEQSPTVDYDAEKEEEIIDPTDEELAYAKEMADKARGRVQYKSDRHDEEQMLMQRLRELRRIKSGV